MINKPIWDFQHEGGHSRPINREVLFNQLVEVKNVFNKHGIKWCLSHGTMLGIYRDGDFIEWDDDIDIAVFPSIKGNDLISLDTFKEYFEVVRKEMRSLGYFVPPCGDKTKPINPLNNMPYYDEVFLRDGEKIEIWLFEKLHIPVKGYFYIYDFPRCGFDLKHETKYYDELQKLTWKDEEFYIPNHIESYLKMMYDANWRVPNPKKKYNHQS